MKKPLKEVLEELTCQPYKMFDGLDYQRMMSLKFPAIRIDVNNEQLTLVIPLNKKNLAKDDEYQQQSETAKTNGTDDLNIDSDNESQKDKDDEQDKNNLVYVCGLIIDIEMITKQQILKLRKLMPKKDYR